MSKHFMGYSQFEAHRADNAGAADSNVNFNFGARCVYIQSNVATEHDVLIRFGASASDFGSNVSATGSRVDAVLLQISKDEPVMFQFATGFEPAGVTIYTTTAADFLITAAR